MSTDPKATPGCEPCRARDRVCLSDAGEENACERDRQEERGAIVGAHAIPAAGCDASPTGDRRAHSPFVSCAALWGKTPENGETTSSGGSATIASEADCLKIIDELFPARSAHVPYGRGDDCAVLTVPPGRLALSTDMFWEDAHFRASYFTPEEAGGKALASAVSDLAAAGAVPLAFSLGLMLPSWLGEPALRAVLTGMADTAGACGIFLSGGDLSRGDKLGFSVTVWGEIPGLNEACPRRAGPGSAEEGGMTAPRQEPTPLRRGAARPGDYIFLVGEAGLARIGLWALENQGRAALEAWPKACAAHLSPRPLLAEGRRIARLAEDNPEEQHRLGLMDLSDGLMRDLPRLLAGLGAELDFSEDLIPQEVITAAKCMGSRPEELFLLGGEDYALLGSCAESLWPRLAGAVPGARPLGRVSGQPGIRLHGRPVVLEGFDHFSGKKSAPAAHKATAAVHETDSSFAPSTVSAQARPPLPAARPGGAEGTPVSASCGPAWSTGPIRNAMDVLIATGRDAWSAGLMAGFNGNISCRVAPEASGPPVAKAAAALERDAGMTSQERSPLRAMEGSAGPTCCPPMAEVCLITRSGAAKGRLTEQDFALLDPQSGRLLAGPPASTESAVHTAIYAACPQTRAILHVHPPCLLALSLLLAPEQRLDLPLPEATSYRACLGHAPFRPPGSAELAEVTAEAAKTHAAVWMERHGLVVHGKDLPGILSLAEELEQLAKVHLSLLAASARA